MNEADQLRAQIRELQSQLADRDDAPTNDVPLVELVEIYLDDLATRVTKRHCGQVRQQIRMVLDGIPATTVGQLRPRHMLAYRKRQLEAGRTHRCCNVHTQALKAALNWAVQMQEIESNPIAGVRCLPTGERHMKQVRRALTEAEIDALLGAAAREDRRLAARGYRVPQEPFWRAMLETAARYGEVTKATWADMDIETMTFSLRAKTTKAGRKREIPLTEVMVSRLHELQACHELMHGRAPKPQDRVFLSPKGEPWREDATNARRILKRLLVAAGIPERNDRDEKIDIHALRHTAITRFARAGVSLAQTQAIAGHSDPKLTAKIYTHLELEDLRGAVRFLEPKAEQEPTPPPPKEPSGLQLLEREAG